MLTVDTCYNADGSPSQYRNAASTRVTACGMSHDRAEERAKLAIGFPLSKDSLPLTCTYKLEKVAGCLCN
jgi:hypothetical protein